ncbi:MAG: hypothetical protein Q7T57_08265 [Dehalococcoidales bacterium]|nr:hypothetical protein [Dehalococcoidales bacterium]
MSEKDLDELLEILEEIALFKSMLPLQLRGHVNALGLYVQIREAGRWIRLQAGGSFRSYLDAWREGDGDWQLRKFDKGNWEHRFAHLVEPTYQIVDFLNDRVASFGKLDSEGVRALDHTLQHYKETSVWLGLPKVSQEVMNKLAKEKARGRLQEEREKRLRRIADAESAIRKDPMDRSAWSSLENLYYKEQRYTDMEKALKMSLKIDAARPYSITYMQLGNLYLAALSVSVRGKGVPILYNFPSNVTAETLGYRIEQLRELAKENLSKAYEIDKKNGRTVYLKELELALKAADTPSIAVFEEFDTYKEQQKQQEENESRQRLNEILHGNNEDEQKNQQTQKDL